MCFVAVLALFGDLSSAKIQVLILVGKIVRRKGTLWQISVLLLEGPPKLKRDQKNNKLKYVSLLM